MPTYDYQCAECDKTEQVTRGMFDPEIAPACPKCSQPMKRKFTSPPTKFKGSGFYTNDKRSSED